MAAANSIGEAVITIGADASQFGSELARSTKGATQQMGKTLSSQMSQTLSTVGKSMQNVGGKMTSYITKPALIAGGAIAGLVGALGFKRLIGLDNAQAKLKGLGYQGQDVKRISDQVAKAIEGGMTTMAEGVDVAAGALASGVKEGKELEKYIKLVGDAAIGSNRPVAEMAQIFNRVQGAGKLMTMELNQIEQGMPGFSNAMAEHLGVPQEELRKMVTAGEISSEEFLTVMDGFAGGMAAAYADTFSGMAKNVLAYIGIIGESLLGGVFEQSKDSLRGFIDILSSEATLEKAAEWGEKLGKGFTKMVDAIKQVIGWWNDLSPTVQKFIGIAAAALVAAGPLLVFFGKIASAIGAAMPFITSIGGKIAALAGSFGGAAGGAGGLIGSFSKMLGWIGLVIAALVAIWTNSETFRNAIMELGGTLFELAKTVGSALMPLLSALFDLVGFLGGVIGNVLGGALDLIMPALQWLAEVIGEGLVLAIDLLVAGIEWLVEAMASGGEGAGFLTDAWGNVMEVFQTIGDWFQNTLVPIFTGVWDSIVESAQVVGEWFSTHFGPLFEALGELFDTVFGGIGEGASGLWEWLQPIFQFIADGWNGLWEGFMAVWETVGAPIIEMIALAWENIKTTFTAVWEIIVAVLQTAWDIILAVIETAIEIITEIVNLFTAVLQGDWQAAWDAIWAILVAVWDLMYSIVESAVNLIGDIIGTVINWVKGIWENVWNAIGEKVTSIWDAIVSAVGTAINWVSSTISSVVNGIRSTWNSVWNSIKSFFTTIWNNIVSAASGFASSVRSTFNTVMNFIRGIPGKVIGFFSNMGSKLVASGRALLDGFLNGIKDGFAAVTGFVGDAIGGIRDFFPFSAAKKGPFSGRGWVTYAGESLGRTFVESTAEALDKGARTVSDSLGDIADSFDSLTGVDAGADMATQLAVGLGRGTSEVERAAGALAKAAQGKLSAGYGLGDMSLSRAPSVSTRGDLARRGVASTASNAQNGTGTAATFASGAIVVQGTLDPARTAQEVANRIAAEAML